MHFEIQKANHDEPITLTQCTKNILDKTWIITKVISVNFVICQLETCKLHHCFIIRFSIFFSEF